VVSGTFKTAFSFLVDPLSALMILVVSGVAFLIHIYSTGYMHDDPGYVRYFSYLNLFTFSMLLLVLANNLLLMYIGWEAVGLCSYLLIGFWYEKKSASDAGKKAFIVNRIGDFGFALGIMLTFVIFGTVYFTPILGRANTEAPPPPLSRCCCFSGRSGNRLKSPSTYGCRTPWRGPPPSRP